MAVGDIVINKQQISPGASLTIQPPAGQEWQLHNIYHEGACELYFCDSTGCFKIDEDDSFGRWSWEILHLTNSFYYTIKNTTGGSIYLGYDGVRTK